MSSPEYYQPGSSEGAASSPFSGEASLEESENRNIDLAAQALARGDVVIMQLYTLGLLVDGTNEEALQKLFAAKQIPIKIDLFQFVGINLGSSNASKEDTSTSSWTS